MTEEKNNQSGFTLIELFIIIPLPIVISWEVGLIILKNYSLNEVSVVQTPLYVTNPAYFRLMVSVVQNPLLEQILCDL